MRSNIFSVADRVRTEVRAWRLMFLSGASGNASTCAEQLLSWRVPFSDSDGDHQRLLARQLFTWELELPMLMPASPCLARGKGGPCGRKREASVRKKVKIAFDPKKFLAKVGEGKTVSSYRKDQTVFSQGEIADAVFYIQQGKVKLTVVSKQGKEAVVAIVGAGHFFGEGCLNGHPLRIATTRAVDDDCVITRLEKATMLATIHKEPEFSELFMSYLLNSKQSN